MDDDDHSDSDDSESSDDEKLSKKRKRHSKHKGKKHAKAHHGKGKECAKPDLFCRLHKYGDHITDNCPDVLRMANQKHLKHQVGSNILKNPFRFCKRSEYFQGHSCKEMRDHNAKQDVGKKEEHKRMSARFAQLKYLGEDHHELDDDELMNSSSKQCKDNIWARAVQKEKTDQCLLLPITIQNIKVMALLDTGCTHSLVQKDFVIANKMHITPTDGSVTLAVDGLTVPRTGSITNVNVEHHDRKFVHSFEILELPDLEIPVYLGMCRVHE